MPEPAVRRRLSGWRALLLLLRGHISRFRPRTLQDVATATLRPGPERQPWVMALVNSSLRLRRGSAYLLVLRPRSELSRLRYRRRIRGAPLLTSHRSISLLCPTRGRVGLARSFVHSVVRTAAFPDRVEVLFYVDDDDPDQQAYRDLVANDRRVRNCVRLTVGPPIGVSAAWNALAESAGGELLAMANDDQLYVDHGWDVQLDLRFEDVTTAHPDQVCCLYFEAGQYPDGTADFPILSRAWYEALGYFTPTIFAQWEVETWVFDLARRVDRLVPVPGVLVEHRHYQDYKAPFDATYQRHRMTREKSFADHGLFLRTDPLRERDADKLRAAIAAAAEPATGTVNQAWFVDHLDKRLPAIRAEAAAGNGGETGSEGDRPATRAVLFRAGERQPDADATPLIAAVLAEIPEATTLSPGSAVLHRLPPGARAQEAITSVGARMLIGVLAERPLQLEPGSSTLSEAEFLVWPAGRPYALHNRSPQTAIVLVLDVPTSDG